MNQYLLNERLEAAKKSIREYRKWYCLCIDMADVFVDSQEVHCRRANEALDIISKLEEEKLVLIEELNR